MKLYYSPGACSLACHIVLEEIGAPYAAQRVEIMQGENRGAAYLAVNPAGLLPALEENGSVLTEASAILISLALRYPETHLLPRDPTRVFEWLSWFASSLHPMYGLLWRPERFTDEEAIRKSLSGGAKQKIAPLYDRMADRLGARSYLAGETFTLADAYGIVFFRWANRVGIPVAANLQEWARRVEARPAVQRTLAAEGISLWS